MKFEPDEYDEDDIPLINACKNCGAECGQYSFCSGDCEDEHRAIWG